MIRCAFAGRLPFACLTAALVLSAALAPLLASRQATAPAPAPAQQAASPRERNVILVLVDGLRWQEVFSGAEAALIDKDIGKVDDVESLRAAFWRDTPEARREALMPFFWRTIAGKGQLIGNQAKGSVARVSNTFNFSYPGYSEMICGFADPRIDSNDQKPNPNVSVFEWLNTRPGFKGRVAAFGAWDTVAWIINRERCGFFVNSGWEPVPDDGSLSERARLLNELKSQSPRRWAGEPDDAITFNAALEYLKRHAPRALWLTFGETDEFAHEGEYDLYLQSAHRTDAMMERLWQTLQSMDQYRDNTTLIIACDHGRGSGLTEWRDHGEKVPESRFIWIAALGPDTPATGEARGDGDEAHAVLQAEIAATVAAAVDEDYRAAQPRAAEPITGVITPQN